MGPKSESEPFLRAIDSEAGHRTHSIEEDLCRGCKKRNQIFTLKTGLVHLCILITYTLIFFGYSWRETTKPRLFFDTIRDLDVRLKPTSYISASSSPYIGRPSPEVDYAWHQLLGNMSIRVTDDELLRNGNRHESVALPEGGQMVWPGVFHQLHCIKKLRRLNYPEVYAANRTEEEALDSEVHINHCLQLLIETIMCNPDTSLTTFTWPDSSPKPELRLGAYERQCVDWEAFMSGIVPRVVSREEVDSLVNPNLT